MRDITIIDHAGRVEGVFSRYADRICDDFRAYRGHVNCTITYAMHFLGGAPAHRPMVETAFAYHDIGLWTTNDLVYLEP